MVSNCLAVRAAPVAGVSVPITQTSAALSVVNAATVRPYSFIGIFVRLTVIIPGGGCCDPG
jgi:hypothetical protein